MVQEANLSIIPLAPLVGSALAFIIGRRAHHLAGWIASLASLIAFGWVIKSVLSIPAEGVLEDNLFTWFSFKGAVTVDFLFRMDHLTAVMALVVTGVGSLIHLYSIAYMHEDESVHRFFSYLNLFMFAMLLLVLGGNLLVLFIGWEGVGLCSYLLIGFWHKNINYAAAGRKAFVVNRIGDAGFLAAVFFCVFLFGTVDFSELAAISFDSIQMAWIPVIAFCLFVGACGKSAQIPLFVWLPDAMAGPTPVSALIHAATMVTAGVYMMARCHFIFDAAPEVMLIVAAIALLTAFVAATTALTQNDIKKVLAYSTVSQLGFMFLAVAAGAYWVAIFHVVTHAFFKACLFLGAGSVIHGCHHEQDMREMGGLRKKMPLTFATYFISVLAIAGIYPLSGYFSKHAILEAVAHTGNVHLVPYAEWIGILATVTAFLTAFYMTRSLVMTFFGEYRGHAHPHESPLLMTGPLVVLAGAAAIFGFFGAPQLFHYLETVLPAHGNHFHAPTILDGVVHSWVGFLGVGLAFLFYSSLKQIPGQIYRAVLPLSVLFSGKYYFDEIYDAMIVRPLEGLARWLWRSFDQSLIDGMVNGTAAVVDATGEVVRASQSGQIRSYALIMFLATVVIMALYLVI